jgi:hypothetical protein
MARNRGRKRSGANKSRRLRHMVKDLYGETCMCCGAEGCENNPAEVDHIYPWAKYPDRRFDISNLQVLCRRCNTKKSDHVAIDYRSEHHKDKLINKLRDIDTKKGKKSVARKEYPPDYKEKAKHILSKLTDQERVIVSRNCKSLEQLHKRVFDKYKILL